MGWLAAAGLGPALRVMPVGWRFGATALWVTPLLQTLAVVWVGRWRLRPSATAGWSRRDLGAAAWAAIATTAVVALAPPRAQLSRIAAALLLPPLLLAAGRLLRWRGAGGWLRLAAWIACLLVAGVVTALWGLPNPLPTLGSLPLVLLLCGAVALLASRRLGELRQDWAWWAIAAWCFGGLGHLLAVFGTPALELLWRAAGWAAWWMAAGLLWVAVRTPGERSVASRGGRRGLSVPRLGAVLLVVALVALLGAGLVGDAPVATTTPWAPPAAAVAVALQLGLVAMVRGAAGLSRRGSARQ